MSDPQDVQQEETAVKPAITRRGFIQGAIAGAALLGTAGVASLTNRASDITAAPAAQSGSGSGGGNQAGSGGGAAAQPPPPTTTPIDPTSDSLFETWNEPWVWRPSDWPGQQLNLNFVENENPGATIGFGNPNAVLFSYGGITPGPTIRMSGDEILFVKLRNFMGANFGETYIKEFPDNAELVEGLSAAQVLKIAQDRGQLQHDWCLEEHTNGQHSARVTNLHTHGLHVRPGRNPDGTHSDNIILRIMPQADLRRRQASNDPNCLFLNPNEQVGEGDYEFRIGNVMGDPSQAHPPGTHWYHPHSHGATHDQVSSGMAGFLIVEGDVDEAINTAFGVNLTLAHNLDEKSGPSDYRERLMFIQRLFGVPASRTADVDAPANQPQRKNVQRPDVIPAINGASTPHTILMRPGAVERWRIINGSVDGRGYKHFMVLKGQYVTDNSLLQRVEKDGSLTPMSLQDIEEAKAQLYHLAMDGITFVEGDSQNASYVLHDLAQQNRPASTNYPLANPLGEDENASMLENIHECFMAENIKDCYVRPNEVYIAPANRADLFFQAPAEADAVYTVVAKAAVLHADTYQQALQLQVQKGNKTLQPWPQHIIVAYVVVKDNPYQLDPTPTPIDPVDVMNTVQKALDTVPVPPYLLPIAADEVMVKDDEAHQAEIGTHTFAVGGQQTMEVEEVSWQVDAGMYRTRTISYSGWGAEGFPLVTSDAELSGEETAVNFQKFIAQDNGHLENLIYAQPSSQKFNVLMPPNTRTMSINNQIDIHFAEGDKRPSPRKFNPVDPTRPIIFVGSAEEWTLYNGGVTLWGDDTAQYYDTANPKDHYIAYALTRGQGHEQFANNNHFRIVTRGVDHPFHMHINPFWVMRIEIPDNDGNLVNILDKPRWQDTVWIPRHGGRVVFRSRFPDFAGIYVNHCHLLLHEDNGMMTPVETTFVAERSNYVPRPAVASSKASADEVNQLYPISDDPDNPIAHLRALYRQSLTMVDPNTTGQVYPGFVVEPPEFTGA